MNKTYIKLIFAALFWAGAFIAGKYSVAEVPPFSISFLRLGLATLILFPIMIWGNKDNWKIKREDWGTILFLGIVGMFGYHVLFFIALKYTSAISSSTIAATNPILVTLMISIWLKQKISWKRCMALALSFSGVLLTLTNGDMALILQQAPNFGDLLMIIAAICWALYSVVTSVKKINQKYEPIVITSYAFLVASVALFPFFLWERPIEFLPTMSAYGIGAILYMAIFPSVLGYTYQQEAIKKIGPQKTAVFVNLVPIFSMILSVVVLGEDTSVVKVLSAGLVIAGVVLNSRIKD